MQAKFYEKRKIYCIFLNTILFVFRSAYWKASLCQLYDQLPSSRFYLTILS